jgi:hypothetical protein
MAPLMIMNERGNIESNRSNIVKSLKQRTSRTVVNPKRLNSCGQRVGLVKKEAGECPTSLAPVSTR